LAGIESRARARPLLVELEAQERAKLESRRKTLLLIKVTPPSSSPSPSPPQLFSTHPFFRLSISWFLFLSFFLIVDTSTIYDFIFQCAS
jgi:hypothetical protein